VRLVDIADHGSWRLMLHGTTLHGAQSQVPDLRCRPLLYYAPETPIGLVFQQMAASRPQLGIGAIGMGAGSVAAYTRPGDRLRFFEIDSNVVRFATDPRRFSFIKGCAQGEVDWLLGDA